MILLNFSHPLSAAQRAQIEALTWQTIDDVIDLPVQLNVWQPFEPQLIELLQHVPLSSSEWQELPIIVNLPGLSVAAGVLLAALHGRMGYFPTIVRLRGVGTPPVYEVAELINLASIRALARKGRK